MVRGGGWGSLQEAYLFRVGQCGGPEAVAVGALAEVGPCPRADAGVEVQVFVIHLDGIAGDGLLPSVAPGFRPSPV